MATFSLLSILVGGVGLLIVITILLFFLKRR